MRVLAASTAGAGHFTPMVPWLTRLVEQGHEVVVVGPPGLAPAAGRWTFRVGGEPDPEVVGEIWERVPTVSREEAGRLVITEIFGRHNSGALVPAVRGAIEELRPDLVLRDPAEFASALCAEEAGVPHVRVGISLGVEDEWVLRGVRPVLEEWRPGLADRVAGSPLVSRFPASLDPSPYEDTRRYRLATPPPREVDPRFVYATLGTVAPTMPPLRPWFDLIPAALAHLPIEALFTVGRDLDLSSVRAFDHVRVEQWADHADVLARAAVIVHHGGSGTTLDALAAGCPQVVVPLFADQGANAVAVTQAGLGRALVQDGGFAWHLPSGGEEAAIRDLVAEVLDSREIRDRAAEVAAEVAALPELDLAMLGVPAGHR